MATVMAKRAGMARKAGAIRAGRAALAFAIGAALLAAPTAPAFAQAAGADGMIVIPGRGESAEAALSNANAHGIAERKPAGPSSINAYSSAELRGAYGGGSAAQGPAPSHDIVLSGGDPSSNTGVVTGGNAAMRAAATAEPPLYPETNRNAAAAGARAQPSAPASVDQTAQANGFAAGYAAGMAAARRAAAQSRPAAPTAPATPAAPARSGYQSAVYRAPVAAASNAGPTAAQDAPPASNSMRYARPGIMRVSTRPSAPAATDVAPVDAQAAPMSSAQAAAAAGPARPAAAPPATSDGMQDPEAIRQAALAFLQQQTVGLPGKAIVTVAPAFPRGLAACTALEPFLPTGARLWGRATVGVRCAGAKPWTLYLQAKISVQGTYYVAAHPIATGDVLTPADIMARDGDLTTMPLAIISDPTQAVGATALVRVAAGLPLRQDMLRSASAVSIGQTVRVVVAGQGFTISSEGSVLNNAGPGQQVRVRMAEGQIVTAVVKDSGTVEIPL